MIATSAELGSVIRDGGYQRAFICDVIVDGVRVLQDIPISGQLKADGTAKIRKQGTMTLVYSDELGTSIVPEDITSWLTPYATFLNVTMIISAGVFSERVYLGNLKIVGVGDPQETKVSHLGRLITIGSSVSLTLADVFAVTTREDFPVPSGPTVLTSVWDEIARVTALPVLRNVPDSAINRAVTYQQNRLDAVFDLATILDGIPYVNAAGQVAIQPNTWGAQLEILEVGESGTIIAVSPNDLSDDGIYNQVVVVSQGTDAAAILATAEVTDGPLRYGGPFGRIPFMASSQFITTVADAQAYADNELPKVSVLQAAVFSIQCLPDPRREVGDVVPFDYNGEQLIGRIQTLTLPDTGPMSLTLLVDRG
jgi:hypothetical protein